MLLPTLSSAGWIRDPSNKLSRLFDYYLTTNKSQSYLYRNSTISFQNTIKEFQHDPNLLSENLETTITAYFNRYFDSSSVAVRTSSIKSDGRYDIHIDITVTENNQRYVLSRAIFMNGSKVISVSNE